MEAKSRENEKPSLTKALVLGIDPGISGAAAFYDFGIRGISALSKMPLMPKGKKKQIDSHALASYFSIFKDRTKLAVIENVTSRPGQGVVSMFTFGQTLGIVQGIVSAFQIPLVLVSPQMWKGALKLSSNKDKSREMASLLFPGLGFTKKSDDGRAEACLIAVYGALYHGNKNQLPPVPVPENSSRLAIKAQERLIGSRNGSGKDRYLDSSGKPIKCPVPHCDLPSHRD